MTEKMKFANLVKNISKTERKRPLLTLHKYWAETGLCVQLKNFKMWRNYLVIDKVPNKKIPSLQLLNQHLGIVKLIESAWLLKDHKCGVFQIGSNNKEIEIYFLKKESEGFLTEPKYLNHKELLRPSKVFNKIFTKYDLNEYRRLMYIWLHNGLSNSSLDNDCTTTEIINIYENIQKLLEASWLINYRVPFKM